ADGRRCRTESAPGGVLPLGAMTAEEGLVTPRALLSVVFFVPPSAVAQAHWQAVDQERLMRGRAPHGDDDHGVFARVGAHGLVDLVGAEGAGESHDAELLARRRRGV